MDLKPDTNSYMQLCLNMDSGPVYLKVPTYYDDNKKEWMGFVHLKNAKKMIFGRGKDSKELENSFNKNLKESLESEHSDETFQLFKPLSFWDEMEEC